MLRDSVQISLSQQVVSGFVRPNRKVYPEGSWDVYVCVSDLSALHQELKSKGATVIRGPDDETFYHTREIEAEDGNGYVCASVKTSRSEVTAQKRAHPV